MVEAEVVGRGSHHAKTNDGCRRDSAGLLVLQNCLLSTLPVQGPAFFRRPNKTIISSPWGRNEAAKLAGAKARRLVVLGGRKRLGRLMVNSRHIGNCFGA